jgi:hypothetical protein
MYVCACAYVDKMRLNYSYKTKPVLNISHVSLWMSFGFFVFFFSKVLCERKAYEPNVWVCCWGPSTVQQLTGWRVCVCELWGSSLGTGWGRDTTSVATPCSKIFRPIYQESWTLGNQFKLAFVRKAPKWVLCENRYKRKYVFDYSYWQYRNRATK